MKYMGRIIVSKASASLPEVDCIPVDRNHVDICKPSSCEDESFFNTRAFLRGCVESVKVAPDPRIVEAGRKFDAYHRKDPAVFPRTVIEQAKASLLVEAVKKELGLP
jgi:hypothetical protein